MRFLQSTILIIGCVAASAQSSKDKKNPGPQSTPVFDPAAIDSTVDACVDFYQYACGTWLAKNPIPPDRPEWARFDELEERNLAILRDILEKAAVSSPKRSPVEQKIGDYYAACMDEAAIEKKGTEPIKPELDRIAALPDKESLAEEVARLQRAGAGVMFLFSSQQDFKNANSMIALADQGGLGLPERDYYLKGDQKSVETRQKYVEHVTKMFQLLGDSQERAAARAQAVMTIETALATGSLDVVTRRDPAKIYHKTRSEELAVSLDPSFGWPRYLKAVNAPSLENLNVAVPEFFKALDSLINTTSMDDWKSYLTWHVVHAQAPLLPRAFVNENFDFFGKFLTGAQELRPRWKRCVQFVDGDLGEALGQKYVDRTFGVEGKERTLQMVHTIEKELGKDLMALDWMSPATKQKAIGKLHAISNKIGYPDKWRDYSSVKIVRGDAVGNDERATEFEFQRELDKIGKPVDHTEWQMTPPTVNAYYDPQMNDINFPAGILQPPMFDKSADDAVNLGAIGSIIGHELTHGFDDEGRKFDAKGNLRDWWTAQDAAAFEKRADCLVGEYSSFKAVDDVKVNGKLTLGENTADYGGLRMAYMALMEDLAAKAMPKADGFTSEQRFFLAYAQSDCENESDELLRLGAQTDPHSPPKFRVNGIVQNMPEFQQAFGCRVGQPMVRKPACRVW
jgi:putative endopeptidase